MTTRGHFWKGGIFLAFLFFVSAWTDAQAAPAVTNLRAGQRPGTHFVDIYYNVATEGNSPLTIHVAVSANGGQSFDVPMFTLSGAVGPGVTPGIDRHIVWNAGVDWGGQFSEECRVKIIADDGITPIAPPAPAGFVRIPAGTFTMGSPAGELGRFPDETQHQVTITRPFHLQATEVTSAQWNEVREWAVQNGYGDLPNGRNGYNGDGSGRHPVTEVSWYDAVKWLNAWSEREGRTPCYTVSGTVYRTG